MSYDPETSLMLLCLSATNEGGTVDRLHAISFENIDWSYILRFSRQNGIAPLLYHNLKQNDLADSIPEGIRLTFEKIYHGVGFQNALYLEELQHLLHILEKAGIRTVLLKGAAIVEDVFRNIALRQMADIDVLVQEEDLDRAEAKVSESGYIPNEYEKSKDWYRKYHHHIAPYYHPDRKIALEIHRHILPPENPFGIEIHKLWERAHPMHIGDTRTSTLSPEDMISHLCLHFAFCGGFIGGLRSLTDIAEALQHHRKRIDWYHIIKEANDHHYINFIYFSLYLAKDLLDAGIEHDMAGRLKQHVKLNAVDFSLLKIMTKNILLKDDASSILPKGYLSLLCKQLLDDGPFHKKLRSFIRRLIGNPDPEIKDSSRSSESDPADFSAAGRIARIFSSNSRHLAKAVFHKGRGKRTYH
ncbi:MAG: nucleotidyltransferase family protein [Nitrospirota bacterium]